MKTTQRQIDEAELRLVNSRVRTREAVARLKADVEAKRAAVRARASRVSTLAIAAAAGILIGKFLLRRIVRRPITPKNVATGGLVAALLSRFGWRFLASSALRLWARGRQRQRQQSFDFSHLPAARRLSPPVARTVH